MHDPAHCLVTGATGGIGLHIARQLAERGWTVLVGARDPARGAQAVAPFDALAPGLRATNLNPRAATAGGDPAEAAAGAVRLALLPDDGPSGQLFSWDGTVVPW
ncbi:MAG: SDR family NAD(P)-dependent oxidoreductase [Solirubrobacteraceae bacterium]